MKRRGFFGSLVAALAAPVLVKAEPAPAPPTAGPRFTDYFDDAPADPGTDSALDEPSCGADADVEYTVDGGHAYQTRGDKLRRAALMAFVKALEDTVDQGCSVDPEESSATRYRRAVEWVPLYQVWYSGFTPESAAAAGRAFGEKFRAMGLTVFATLELPHGVWSAERQTSTRVSARMVVQYDLSTDSLPVRIDVWARKA